MHDKAQPVFRKRYVAPAKDRDRRTDAQTDGWMIDKGIPILRLPSLVPQKLYQFYYELYDNIILH